MSASKQGGSNLVILAALAANLGIAVAKFIAAGISGSSSMLTEGFHSVIDSLNQILLLYGQKRGKQPPDEAYPFGHGRELYFWSFVVAILIFAAGAGISVYEGYEHFIHPEELSSPLLNYIVLGVAFAMEGTSWFIAMREFNATRGAVGWWQSIRDSKDPAGFIILFEDSAALAGLIIAAIGIWASHFFDDARLDGIASIAIGVVLALVAIFLAREAKGLLIGEGADAAVVAKVRAIVDRYPDITTVNHVRTIHTAPDRIFVAISADFRDTLSMGDAETLIERIEAELKAAEPMLSSIYIRPEKAEDAPPISVEAKTP
ncbi:MAG: cation diffusion facilitator family transporter [Pseudomonadota bacterium]|uniref:cation diffusion facilitator family transporter n=1 Tax=Sphingomonas sp. ERG5 TaxID=1381597 RepID=UPI00054B61B9|nr:cation diffusion facilitator family transporter [Sphingomonas sp. ERG5]